MIVNGAVKKAIDEVLKEVKNMIGNRLYFKAIYNDLIFILNFLFISSYSKSNNSLHFQ